LGETDGKKGGEKVLLEKIRGTREDNHLKKGGTEKKRKEGRMRKEEGH